jgi:alcohol dehydrogenase (cytochrome c)
VDDDQVVAGGATNIRGAILEVNGILYPTTPDNAWAIDARDGREIWHYFWKTRGGIHIGNRGVGMYGNWIFFLTPDNYFVSLEAATGKERWHHEIANVKREYFSTSAPITPGRRIRAGPSPLAPASPLTSSPR